MASVAKRKWTHNGVTSERWVVRYKDKGGAHRSRQFKTKKPADDFRRDVENELEAGAHVARTQTRTVAETCEEYLDRLRDRAAAGSIAPHYPDAVSRYLTLSSATIGAIKLTDLRWEDIEGLARDLGKRQHARHGRPIMPSTVKAVLDDISAAIDFGVRRGYAARNVVKDARREIGPLTSPPRATFSREQVRQIFVALEAQQQGMSPFSRSRERAMVYLAAACGLRRGEILGLTLQAIDFDGKAINVAHNLRQADDVMKGPKTIAGLRTVPLPDAVADAIKAYLPHAKPDARGLIFRTKSGGEICGAAQHSSWRSLLRRASIPIADERGRFYQFHALRHFAGSAWLDAGVPLADVSRLLGHANPAITAQIYSHSISDPFSRAGALGNCATALLPAPLDCARITQGELTH